MTIASNANVVRLSALDQFRPLSMPSLVQRLDILGYHRYWASEHHQPGRSPNPMLVATLAGCLTTRLRVGTAGVMLRYRSVAEVLANIAVLNRMFPGRVDLGMIGGRSMDPGVDDALLGDQETDVLGYHDKVRRVHDAVLQIEHPGSAARPQMWICSTAHTSARLAGELGVGFATYNVAEGRSRRPVVVAYLDALARAIPTIEPQLAVVCSGVCAETEEEAVAAWLEMGARIGGSGTAAMPRQSDADFLGSPAQCHDQLMEVVTRHGSCELVLQCIALHPEQRLRSFVLLAEAFGLRAA